MKTIEINLPLFTGYYGSILNSDSAEESELEEINQDREEEDYLKWKDIDWNYKEFNDRLSKAIVDYVEEQMKEVFNAPLSLKFKELVSPKYYNFANDRIFVEMEYREDLLTEMIAELQKEDNKDEFEQFLIDNYKSRSGFTSFYSHDYNEWIFEYLNPNHEKFEHCFGAVIDFHLRMEIRGSYTDSFDNEIYSSDAVGQELYMIEYTIPSEEEE